MPIINAFPDSGSTDSFDDAFVGCTYITRDQMYSTSRSTTVTDIGFVSTTGLPSTLYIYARYANSTSGNQQAYFYALKDANVSVYAGAAFKSNVAIKRGHQYRFAKYRPSSSANAYIAFSDITAGSALYSFNTSNESAKLTFS